MISFINFLHENGVVFEGLSGWLSRVINGPDEPSPQQPSADELKAGQDEQLQKTRELLKHNIRGWAGRMPEEEVLQVFDTPDTEYNRYIRYGYITKDEALGWFREAEQEQAARRQASDQQQAAAQQAKDQEQAAAQQAIAQQEKAAKLRAQKDRKNARARELRAEKKGPAPVVLNFQDYVRQRDLAKSPPAIDQPNIS